MGARVRLRDLGDRAGVGSARADRARARRAPGPRPIALGDRRSARRRPRARTRRSRSPSRCSRRARSAAAALAFQFASTNLVWELGLVLWVLIGWQFTVAEYVGGIVMIVLMAVLRRGCSSAARSSDEAREHARAADTGHQHHTAGRALLLARAADLRAARGRTSRTTSAATGRCCGRRSPSGSCSPGSSRSSATVLSSACSSIARRRRCRRSRT